MKKEIKLEVGSITLNEKVMVSDPCYGTDVWCNAIIDNVLSGVYNAFVVIADCDRWGQRVKELTICHESKKPIKTLSCLELASANIGVDSATCGIYDYDYYTQNHDTKNANDEWYDKNVCNGFWDNETKTHMTNGVGIHSCTGYGDGMYEVFVKRDGNDKVVQITLTYL